MTETNNTLSEDVLPEAVKISIQAAQEKKAEAIVVLELKAISSFTDYFVIVNGNSNRQNLAVCESVERALREQKIHSLGIEGKKNAEWILMDYGSFIFHVFSPEARSHYALEKLWADSPRLSVT